MKYRLYALRKPSNKYVFLALVVIMPLLLSLATILFILRPFDIERKTGNADEGSSKEAYSENVKANHTVRATVFWVGEDAGSDNRFITNRSSAWVSNWIGSYGGIDAPKPRCGPATRSLPCSFVPRENPFYFALPFNDFDAAGTLKSEATLSRIPWYEVRPLPQQSLVKNHWIAATYAGKTAYAQWQDVGPFGENDVEYVFGDKPPKAGVGLDLSPATAIFLGVDGEDEVSWRFVDEASVPDGPWREVITRGGLQFE